MKRALVLAAAGLVIASLAACAPDTGDVIDKSAQPGHMTWVPGHWSGGYCVSYRKNGGCAARSPRIYYPGYMRWVPPRWLLKLRDGEDTGWREVGVGLWDSCTVGTHFDGTRCERQEDRW